MFTPRPMSASPTYARCGTFEPLPTWEFLISTNVPAFEPWSRTVPGRRLAYGPTFAFEPIFEPRTTENWTSAPSPTVESTMRVAGPMVAPAPILVSPSR